MSDSLKKISNIKDKLINYLDDALSSGGIECIQHEDLDSIADAIKDLSESEKECWEAKYYEAVVEAMEDPEHHSEEMMYYRPNPRMGYHPERTYMNEVTAPYLSNEWRMPRDYDDAKRMEDLNRNGRAYSEYQRAKRNYTQTHNQSDHSEMEVMADKHLHNALDSLREMWTDADSDLKVKMKSDLSKLVAEMNV